MLHVQHIKLQFIMFGLKATLNQFISNRLNSIILIRSDHSIKKNLILSSIILKHFLVLGWYMVNTTKMPPRMTKYKQNTVLRFSKGMYVCLVLDEKSSKYSLTDRYIFTILPTTENTFWFDLSYHLRIKPVSKVLWTLEERSQSPI